MFGIGFFEFLLILLAVLVFVRPDDLPKFLYRVGKIYSEIRSAYYSVIREMNLLSNQAREMIDQEQEDFVDDAQPQKALSETTLKAKKKKTGKATPVTRKISSKKPKKKNGVVEKKLGQKNKKSSK